MIDSSKELPMVELAGGLLLLEPTWVTQMLSRAAHAAGHTLWWPAEHIATTVQAFFQNTLPSQPICFQRFRTSVHRLLEQLGHADVAQTFLREGMDLGISLLELVDRVPPGFELALFEECDRSLQSLTESRAVARAFLWDLAPGIKRFLRKTHWNRECDWLRDELVHHLRHRLVQLAGDGSITLSIR
jgi:hypothetical protein